MKNKVLRIIGYCMTGFLIIVCIVGAIGTIATYGIWKFLVALVLYTLVAGFCFVAQWLVSKGKEDK